MDRAREIAPRREAHLAAPGLAAGIDGLLNGGGIEFFAIAFGALFADVKLARTSCAGAECEQEDQQEEKEEGGEKLIHRMAILADDKTSTGAGKVESGKQKEASQNFHASKFVQPSTSPRMHKEWNVLFLATLPGRFFWKACRPLGQGGWPTKLTGILELNASAKSKNTNIQTFTFLHFLTGALAFW